MSNRYPSILPLLAAAAVVTFSWTTTELGAQVAPPPARPAKPVAPPRPSTPPAPAAPVAPVAPPTSIYGRVWDGGLFDRSAFDAERIAMDAELAALRVGELAIERSALSGSRIAEQVARATADVYRLADLPALVSMAPMPPMPMAPMTLMEPMPPMPAMAWGDFAFQGPSSRYIDDSRVSSRPPESWAPQDPADSLYREARRSLSNDSYRRAAELFRRIRDQYPKSTYTPDAPYWEAFALQRLGSESDLRAAQEALTWQQRQYPKAATRGDASALSTRIDGALARRGDSRAYENLLGQVNQATSQGCARDDQDERVAALNALSRLDSAQLLPTLKKVLARRESCTQALRRNAVWLYARSKASDAPQVLMNVARTDPDKEVRDQAVFWMANVPTEEATSMLVDLAKNGSDIDLRRRAVYALSRSKSTRAASTLRDIATDANAPTELRSDALSYYMSTSGKSADDAMSFLRDVYGKADEQQFRTRVLSSIANRKTDDAREFLTSVAQNSRENLETRRYAISLLANAGATASQLASIYDRSSNDIEIRKQAVGVLASLKDNAGVDKLLDVARNEKNMELRRQAVSYLVRVKDPRAVALLQEIILR